MKEDRIFTTAKYAMELFNDAMGTSFSLDSVIVCCLTPETGLSIYKAVCSEYFPSWEDSAVDDENYFESFLGYAIYADDHDGILLRSDVELATEELVAVLLHELAHIFCSHTEIPDGRFYARYCENDNGNTIENGMTCAGYAIWREFIADLVMSKINPFYRRRHLKDSRAEIKRLLSELSQYNSNAKLCMSLVLSHVMCCAEIEKSEAWDAAEAILRKSKLFPREQYFSIFRLVSDDLHEGNFWTITPEFVTDLGNQYLCLQTAILMDSI